MGANRVGRGGKGFAPAAQSSALRAEHVRSVSDGIAIDAEKSRAE